MQCSSGADSDSHQIMAPQHRSRQTENHLLPQGLLGLYATEFFLYVKHRDHVLPEVLEHQCYEKSGDRKC